MDTFERAMELDFLETMEQADSDSEEDEGYELELAGLVPEELELMDEDERREVLEEAGLDPDHFDF